MANSIRNFCIIAHIDHGKSTLADRLLEMTGTISQDKLKPQLLDSLALERERGITIKLAPVRMQWKVESGKLKVERSKDVSQFSTLNSQLSISDSEYILNLIDTPGHVDFSYEVSRSLAAVEGAILLVDATQGIQAQTLAHGLSALAQHLTLIPAINKIDLPNADIKETKKQLVETFGFREDEIMLVSGKTGEGVLELLQAVTERIPNPSISVTSQLRALIFDSFFDHYKGVVAQVRIFSGEVPAIGSKITFLATKTWGQVLEKGVFAPQLTPAQNLTAGEIGYIATGIKEPDLVRVGDTISTDLAIEPLAGYKTVKPMVFVGLFPTDQKDYAKAKDALSKFRLNDPSFTFELEKSQALGAGFRCGFLGLLHAEVAQERLIGEFGVDLIATAPSVEYLVGGKPLNNPSEFDPSLKDLPAGRQGVEEPWVSIKIFSPQKFIGPTMDLLQEKRGKFLTMEHFGSQVELRYEIPLSEMVTDFYDRLKSVSSGFASLDWDFLEFRPVDAARLDIFVAGEIVDALSMIIVKERAELAGRRMVEKLKEVLPRQQFEIPIQAAIGSRIVARETLSAFRKDVTQKLYGGDRTRKDKLLEAQKKGKKRMKMVGKVEIPQEAFLAVLKS